MSNELAFNLSGHETDQVSGGASNPDGDVHLLSGIARIHNLEIKQKNTTFSLEISDHIY